MPRSALYARRGGRRRNEALFRAKLEIVEPLTRPQSKMSWAGVEPDIFCRLGVGYGLSEERTFAETNTNPGILNASCTEPPVDEVLEIDFLLHNHCGTLPSAEWSGGGAENTAQASLRSAWKKNGGGSNSNLAPLVMSLVLGACRRQLEVWDPLCW